MSVFVEVAKLIARLFPPYRSRAARAVKSYLDQLISREGVTRSEIIQAHIALLSVSNNHEQRLRSIQTLAALEYPRVLSYVLAELISYADGGKQEPPPGAYAMLTEILAESTQNLLQLLQTQPRDKRSDAASSPLQRDVHAYMVPLSFGLALDNFKLPRVLAINVYLSVADSSALEALTRGVQRFCDRLDLEISDEFAAISGSWYKRWYVKTKQALTQPEVMDRLKRAERALELIAVHKQQAGVDRDQAEGAAALISSLGNTPNAACQIGSILVIKVTDSVGRTRLYTRTLTPDEMIELERHPKLLGDPETVLDRLNDFSSPPQGISGE